MKRKHIVNLVILLAFEIFIILLLVIFNGSVYIFDGLVGPAESSVVQRTDDNPFNRYSRGTSSRLAILLTDTKGAWLGLAHGLKSMGVPFLITTDYKWALEHKVVLVYPMISGSV